MDQLGGRLYVTALLLCVSAAAAAASTEDRVSYFKAGGVLELRPSGAAEINSLSWKRGNFLVAEWIKNKLPLKYYGKFDGRTELDTNTGQLRIRDTTAEDAGAYKLELNGVIQEEPYEARIPTEVPEPLVRTHPLSCNHDSEKCTATCNGDVSRAGDVTYRWRMGEGEWVKLEQTIDIINNEDMKKVKTLTCRIENVIGGKDSPAIENPFYGDGGSIVGKVVGGIFGSVAVALLGGLVFFVWKRKRVSADNAEPPKPEENVPLSTESPPAADNGTPAAPKASDKEPEARETPAAPKASGKEPEP